MSALRVFLARLVGVFRRKNAELDQDIQTHLALLTEEHIRSGMSLHEARLAARRSFGGVTQTRETYRDQRGFSSIDALFQDVRFAARGLRRSPGFALTVVLTLGLGIGANTSLFSLLDAVLLRPLPFRDPAHLVEIWGRDTERAGLRVPAALFQAVRDRSTTLEGMAIHSPEGGELRTADGPVRILGRRVSANYFDVLGVRPVAGRTLVAGDETAGAPPVLVVSHGFWQQRLGGDPSAVGQTIYLGANPYSVVGIMPADFRTSFRQRSEDFWTPHVREAIRQLESQAGFELVGRLASGVSVVDARRELHAIGAAVHLDGWGSDGRRLDLVPVLDEIVGDSAYVLQLVAVAVAVLLAIVCANVALLSLARSDRRFTEFATRKALGATGMQLVRLALLESVLLSAVGGAAGIALSYWLMPALLALAPMEIPRLADARVDDRVLLVALVLSVVAGVGCGLAPAVRLSRFSVIDAIKRGTGTVPRHRAGFRSSLVVAQVAAAVALLVFAGLIGRTFLTLLPSHPGFEPRFRSVFGVILPPANQGDRVRALGQLADRLATLPDVQGAALGSNVPFGGDDGFRRIAVVDGPGPDLRADLRAVTNGYFNILQMPLVAGRGFSDEGPSSVGAAIVNETVARKLGGAVLGRRLTIASPQAPLPAYEIVGIVRDARSSGTITTVWDEVYIPLAQSNPSIMIAIVVSTVDAVTLDPVVRRELRAVWPDRVDDPVERLTPMETLVDQALARPRFSATLISAFSTAALALAAIGVFALIAYSVAQRQAELGLRAALGADSRQLLLMILTSTVGLAAVGVAIGLGAASYLTRFVVSELYAVDALDLPTYVAAAAVMLMVAGAAAFIPARRAARVDPMVALRCE